MSRCLELYKKVVSLLQRRKCETQQVMAIIPTVHLVPQLDTQHKYHVQPGANFQPCHNLAKQFLVPKNETNHTT